MTCEITKINDQTWVFDEGGVRFFLLCGDEKALLLDSGMETKNAKELAESLTDLPLELMNTHADRDHIASNDEFPWFYMNPAEASNLYHSQNGGGVICPVEQGDVIDLGGRELFIISLPGHTPGSIAVLDRKYRALYSGDPIQDGRIFMFGIQRELHAYRLSLRKLDAYRNEFDAVYPSHGTCPVKPELIDELYEVSGKILEGADLPYTEHELFGSKVRICHGGCADFILDPEA